MYWHGHGGSYRDFLDMPLTDRFLAREALSEIIERSNENSTSRPKDQR